MDIFTPFRVIRGNVGGLLNCIFISDRKRPAGERRLFVDITETRRQDMHTGVPRVTDSVLAELHGMGLPYTIVEVYARPHFEGFFTVSGSRPVRVVPGDVFFGLDLSKFLTQKNRPFLDRIHRLGVPVYFYVHDLIPIRYPEFCPKNVVRAFSRWLATVSRYTGLIANSRSTRNDFAACLAGKEHRAYNEKILIDFAYPGSSFVARPPRKREEPRGGRTGGGGLSFIAVGAMEKRKGYVQLLGAFDILWGKGLDLRLTIVGPAYYWSGEVEEAVRANSRYGRSLFWRGDYISDGELAALYGESDAYISSSFAEGFGLPVVEAASCGIPLILRDIPVFRELGGEGAFYFSADSEQALASALEEWIARYAEGKVPLPGIKWRSWRNCAEDICRTILPDYTPSVPGGACGRKGAGKAACDVSVIIVNYNTCALLHDCLVSLYEKTEELDFEVIVSDNGSIDDSVDMVRKDFPQVLLLENMANLGFGAANNRALDRASGKYVFYLNSDTLLLNNAVKIFFDYWESHPEEKLGALGCNLEWPDGRLCLSSGASRTGRFGSASDFRRNQRRLCLRSYKVALRHYIFRKPLRPVEDQDPPVEKFVGQVGYVTGADLFLLNDGNARFDEDFFMYYEEVDLEYALWEAGKRACLIDGPRIVHLEGASSSRGRYEVLDQTDFSKIQMTLSAIRFFKKHGLGGPLSLLVTKLYTAALWLNPIIVRDTRRYIGRLLSI
ncbi:MAG: glycosyltransferase [Treponema sp.]|nr:glycosyltransferase [Treponema sp.]